MTDKRIKEASGIAESPSERGRFYAHNDSGDRARIFAFDAKGHVRQIRIESAQNVDWEDMAAVKLDGRPYLFIGDIGDNGGRRRSITVYRVPEPEALATSARPDRVYKLQYPDEPHNAETLMVHPTTGEIVIVTKAANRPSMVFRLPANLDSGDYKLEKVGELKVGGAIRESRLITGGCISPDGQHVILRTYLSAYEFDIGNGLASWIGTEPRVVRTNIDPQGEGIAYRTDGSALVTDSEGSPCQVSIIPLER